MLISRPQQNIFTVGIMGKERDIRELSTTPEPEDGTDYQALNSLDRPKVLGQAEADNDKPTPAQEGKGANDHTAVPVVSVGELSEQGFRALCREAMVDSRSIDPDAFLFEILVRLRTRAGDPEARGRIPVEYETTSGETYWRAIEELAKGRFKADYDVRGILTEAIQENTKLKEL
jgi:hypothetical protein